VSITDAQSELPPPKTPQSQTEPQQRPLLSKLKYFDTSLRNVWFYVALIALIINLSYTFRPQFNAQASTMSDGNPLSTLYTLFNTGPWTLYNVGMKCVISYDKNKKINLENNEMHLGENSPALGNPTIPALKPTATATRDCGIGGNFIHIEIPHMETVRIDLEISYDWFFGIISANENRHFDTRRVGDKFILVPDVERH
jgi:hypothetical protein